MVIRTGLPVIVLILIAKYLTVCMVFPHMTLISAQFCEKTMEVDPVS